MLHCMDKSKNYSASTVELFFDDIRQLFYQCGALSDEHIRISLFEHLCDTELNRRCNYSRDIRPGNFLLDSGIFFDGCSRLLPKLTLV